MKLLRCPINGVRPLQEFAFGGEVRPMPDPAQATDPEWADYVFNRCGEPGVHREWWYHLASGTWFIAERDNLKDIFIRTYLANSSDVAPASASTSAEVSAAAGSSPRAQPQLSVEGMSS